MGQKISEAEQLRRAKQRAEAERRRAMNIAEFCERYATRRTTAYEELKSGRLRGRKIGRRTIITEDDAEAWLRHLPPFVSSSS
jgi:hypothetical protein